MAKLPFVVQPRLKPLVEVIGSEESGKIEIERRGYLTAAEKAFIQTQAGNDTATQLLVNLCRVVATAERLDMSNAYDVVVDVMSGKAPTTRHKVIQENYRQEIDELMAQMGSVETTKRLMQAHCMLLYRVSEEITVEDTLKIHPDLLEALADFYVDEELKSIARLEDAIKQTTDTNSSVIEQLEKK